MTQGWCIIGDAVIGQRVTRRVAIFYPTEPRITYRSSPADENFWGYKYTTFNSNISFVDGSYNISQRDEASCNLNAPPPTPKYDCLNGICVLSTQYNTPGIYSLSECEQTCGTGCSGKCISNADWATIEGLAGQLKNKNCG